VAHAHTLTYTQAQAKQQSDSQNFLTPVIAVTTVHMGVTTP